MNERIRNDARLAVEFCGLTLRTPLVLLSGCVGFGEEYTRVAGFTNADAGAICLKGTTLAPRLGNRPHRVYETPAGMLNAIACKIRVRGSGRRHSADPDFGETRFIQCLRVDRGRVRGGHAHLRRLAHRCHRINISCPNVKEGGVTFSTIRHVRPRRRRLPRATATHHQASPNQTDIADNARRCIEAGTDAFAVINT